MKDLLSWIVLYNCRFPINHPSLYDECKKLEKEGKLKLIKYKNFLDSEDKLKDICEALEYPQDILVKSKRDILSDRPFSEASKKILKATKKYLTSVTSLWYYKPWNEYTRADVGEPELKYLIKSERRMPKWKKTN